MFKTKFYSEVKATFSVLIQMLGLNDGSSTLCKSLERERGNGMVKDVRVFFFVTPHGLIHVLLFRDQELRNIYL